MFNWSLPPSLKDKEKEKDLISISLAPFCYTVQTPLGEQDEYFYSVAEINLLQTLSSLTEVLRESMRNCG